MSRNFNTSKDVWPGASTYSSGSPSWATIDMVHWMENVGDEFEAIQDTIGYGSGLDLTTRLDVLEASKGPTRWETMTAVPGFCDRTLTYPDVTANHQYDLSISSGKLRFTGHTGITDNSLRKVYGLTSAGVLGDSEVRSSIIACSVDWNTTDGRVQPGHCHRVSATRMSLDQGVATSATGTTVSDSGKSWTTNGFTGPTVHYREVWVQITDGTGSSQKRRVISNTGTQLTVDHAWTTNPDTTSTYEIFTYQVRALTFVLGVVAGHTYMQPNIWDNGCYRQPDTGQQNLGSYLRPLAIFGPYNAFPWNMKSRVVGNTFEMAIWTGSDPEAAYGASGQSASWTLGAGDDYGFADEPGMSGLYMAHLNAGDTIDIDNLLVTPL